MSSYGTAASMRADEPLLVSQVESIREGTSSMKRILLAGLVVMAIFTAAIFGMVVTAIEHSKEISVHQSALYDRASLNVASTRSHEEVIENPLSAEGAAGVKYINMGSTLDGSASRYVVTGYSSHPCKSGADGFCYTFNTALGDFAGEHITGVDGEKTVTFRALSDEESVHRRSLLAVADEAVVGLATGAPGSPVAIRMLESSTGCTEPVSKTQTWNELNFVEKYGAKYLGWSSWTWVLCDLMPSKCDLWAPEAMTKTWSELTATEAVGANLLGYKECSWAQ